MSKIDVDGIGWRKHVEGFLRDTFPAYVPFDLPHLPVDPPDDPPGNLMGWELDYTNTGVERFGLDLIPTQSRTITQDGTVIDGEHITGTLTIHARDVKITRCRIDSGGGDYALRTEFDRGYTVVAEDCTISGGNSSGVLGTGITLRRCQVIGADDGIKPYGDNVFEETWVHDVTRAHGAGSHSDCIQFDSGGPITNVSITRCRLDATQDKPGEYINSAIQVMPHSRQPVSGVFVTGCLLEGGDETVNGEPSSQDVIFKDNRFGVQGAQWASPLSHAQCDHSNVWHTSGTTDWGQQVVEGQPVIP